MDMNCIYDSDLFIVVHIANIPHGSGFEIVNKKTEISTYLTGMMAEFFKLRIAGWQADIPEEHDVNVALDGYTIFAQNTPLLMH